MSDATREPGKFPLSMQQESIRSMDYERYEPVFDFAELSLHQVRFLLLLICFAVV